MYIKEIEIYIVEIKMYIEEIEKRIEETPMSFSMGLFNKLCQKG